MSQSARNHRYASTSAVTPRHLAVWNRRLLIGAAVMILWAASVLALHAAGPNAQAMLAGEGMLISEAR